MACTPSILCDITRQRMSSSLLLFPSLSPEYRLGV